MKKNYYLSKREGLALAIEQLLHYNVWATVSLDESVFEEEALLDYFEADFDDPINAETEKVIAAAVVNTVYEKNYIPEENKREFAQKVVRQHIDNLRAAKITYHEEVKGMSRREAQARREELKMVSRMAVVDNTVKWGVRRAAKAGLSYGIAALVTALIPEIAIPAWILSFATYGIISMLPEKVKKPIRKGVTKAVDTVTMAAKNIADELATRAVNVAEKAKTVIEKASNTAKQFWEDTKVVAHEAWENTKVGAQQAWEFTKDTYNKVKEKVKRRFGL